MTPTLFLYIASLFILTLLQVVIFNNIYLFGSINPLIYVVFVILAHFKLNKTLFLFFCFFLGLAIDFFESSLAVNAFSITFVGFIRFPLMRYILGKTHLEFKTLRFSDLSLLQFISYVLFLVLSHHFVLFFLESFKLSNLSSIALQAIYTSIFTSLLIFIYVNLTNFRKRK